MPATASGLRKMALISVLLPTPGLADDEDVRVAELLDLALAVAREERVVVEVAVVGRRRFGRLALAPAVADGPPRMAEAIDDILARASGPVARVAGDAAGPGSLIVERHPPVVPKREVSTC